MGEKSVCYLVFHPSAPVVARMLAGEAVSTAAVPSHHWPTLQAAYESMDSWASNGGREGRYLAVEYDVTDEVNERGVHRLAFRRVVGWYSRAKGLHHDAEFLRSQAHKNGSTMGDLPETVPGG